MMADRIDEHEEAPPPKRLKSTNNESPTLNEDALALVMEFLAPRELYSLAFTCKGLLARVTTKLVLRSTILNTVYTSYRKLTLGNLAYCIDKQSIHVPSPCRLLRLVNGKRCELCNKNRVNHVRGNGGCFFCGKCQEVVSSYFSKHEFKSLPDHLQADERIGSYRVGERPWEEQITASDGERIGQLLTYKDIFAMSQSPDGKSVDEYLCNVLDVPSSADDCEKWMEEYKSAKEAEESLRKRLEAKEREKTRQKREKRKQKIQKFLRQVKKHLDEAWKDFALDFDYSEMRFSKLGSSAIEDSVPFRCPFVDFLMQDFARAPSKAKNKFAVGLARDINRVYRRIRESLLSFSFLNENDPGEARLKAYAMQHWTDLRSFVHSPSFYYSGSRLKEFDADMENARFVECWMDQNFGFLLAEPLNDTPWVIGLAQNIWSDEMWSYKYSAPFEHLRETNRQQFRGCFRQCKSVFLQAEQNGEAFLSWLSSEGADENEVHRAQKAIQRNYGSGDLLATMRFEEFRALYVNDEC